MQNRENQNETNDFCYTYSAPTSAERREIEDIRKQYLPAAEKIDKIDELKALDAKVKRLPFVLALTIGIAGILLFGLGMSMVLVWHALAGGIVVVAVGAAVSAAAYPLRHIMLGRNKEKYGAEIIRLSEQLLGKEEKK